MDKVEKLNLEKSFLLERIRNIELEIESLSEIEDVKKLNHVDVDFSSLIFDKKFSTIIINRDWSNFSFNSLSEDNSKLSKEYDMHFIKFNELMESIKNKSMVLFNLINSIEVLNLTSVNVNWLKLNPTYKKTFLVLIGQEKNFNLSCFLESLKRERFLSSASFDLVISFMNEISRNEIDLIDSESISIYYDDYLHDLFSDFLMHLKAKDKRAYEIFRSYSGFETEKRTLENISKDFGLVRERIRQIYDDIWTEFSKFILVDENFSDFLIDNLNQGKSFDTIFPKFIKKIKEEDLLLILDRIIGIKKVLTQYKDSATTMYFNDLVANERFPINIDVIFNLISDHFNTSNQLSISYIYSQLINKGKIKSVDGGIIVSDVNISSLFSQAFLNFPNGATLEQARDKITEFVPDFIRGSSRYELFQSSQLGYIYMYHDGKYRSVSFFNNEYDSNRILSIVKDVYEFLKKEKGFSTIQKLKQDCFNNTIDYFDLRHLLSFHGLSFSGNEVFFDGKSTKDIVFLEGFGVCEYKDAVVNFIKNKNTEFTMQDVLLEVTLSDNSLVNIFTTLIRSGYISKIDENNYLLGSEFKKRFEAFKFKDKILDNLRIYLNLDKPITINYLLSKVTGDYLRDFKLNKQYLLSIIRVYSEFNYIDISLNNIIYKKGDSKKSIKAIIEEKNALFPNNLNALYAEILKEIYLTEREMKMSVSSFFALNDKLRN